MKSVSIISAVIVSTALSLPAFAYTTATSKPALIVDPITGVVEGTTRIFTGVTTNTWGWASGMGRGTSSFLTGWNRTTIPNDGKVYYGINNNTPYMVTETGVQTPGFSRMHKGTNYVITDMDNGKKYRVVNLKTGTMDVMRGNKVTRYQYVQPIVRAL